MIATKLADIKLESSKVILLNSRENLSRDFRVICMRKCIERLSIVFKANGKHEIQVEKLSK